MNTLTKKLFVLALSILTTQRVLGLEVAKRFKADQNSTCIIRHNLDNKELQVYFLYDEKPYQGITVFTDKMAPYGANWNILPVENSTELFRLRNVQFNQYLAIWKPSWCTSYYEDYGRFDDYVWRLEEISENNGYLIHHSTNLCMGEELVSVPPFGQVLVPFMNTTCSGSTFTFVCSE